MKKISRRSFLKGAGVTTLGVAAATALTACGGSSAPSSSAAASSAASSEAAGSDVLAQFDAAAASLADWSGSFDSLIAQIYVEADLKERENMMHVAEDILMSTWCIVPLYYYVNQYVMKDTMTGMTNMVTGMKYFMYAQNSANPGVLNMCLASEPDHLDPALNSSVDGGCLAVNTFAGLLTYDSNKALAPDCAEKWEVSEDGYTYTFTLREGLKWSNGDKLDANDFVYSWKRAAADETTADYAYLFDCIARDDAGEFKMSASEDGKTLTVELGTVCPYFLDLCAFPAFFPVHQASVEAANPDGTTPGAWADAGAGFVTNGAFTCTEWKHDSSMVYKKNPNYWNAENVTIETMNFMLTSEDTSAFAAFNNGNLDLSLLIPTEEIAGLKGNSEYHVDPYLGTYYVGINCKSSLFASMSAQQACALRKALTLAIDRDYIVTTVAQGGQIPANTFVPAGCSDGNGGEFRANDADYKFPDEANVGYYDPMTSSTNEEIAELLTAAGFTVTAEGTLDASTPFAFEYLVNTSSGNVAIAESIQQDMNAIGVEMKIQQEEWNVFLNDRKNGNYDIAREGWVMDFNDPMNMLDMWTTESGNNDCQFGR